MVAAQEMTEPTDGDPEFSPLAPNIRCKLVKQITIHRLERNEDDEEEKVFIRHALPASFTKEMLADHAGGGRYLVVWRGERARFLGQQKIRIGGRPKEDEESEDPGAVPQLIGPDGTRALLPKLSEDMQNGYAAFMAKALLASASAPAQPQHNALELQMVAAQLHRMQADYDDSRRRMLAEIDELRGTIRKLTEENFALIKRLGAAENRVNAPQSWADEATKIAPLIGGFLDKIIPAKEIAGPAANAAAKVTLG